MKLQNSTHWPNHFLRRMIGWCCKQVEVPTSKLRSARFTKCSDAYRGYYLAGSITVRIGSPERYPTPAFVRHGVQHPSHADPLEGLVSTTAHELTHLWQYRSRAKRVHVGERLEPQAIWTEGKVLETFRANREALLEAWSAAPERLAADAPPRPTMIDRRAAKAADALKRWTAKLKLAQTKIKKYKRQVAYYQRKTTTAN